MRGSGLVIFVVEGPSALTLNRCLAKAFEILGSDAASARVRGP